MSPSDFDDPEFRHHYAHPDQSIDAVLCSQLRHTRKLRGLSRKELAKRIQMDESTIIKIENGTIAPSFKTLYKIAQVLDVVCETRLNSFAQFLSEPLTGVELVEVPPYGADHRRFTRNPWIALSKDTSVAENVPILLVNHQERRPRSGQVVRGLFYEYDGSTARYFPRPQLSQANGFKPMTHYQLIDLTF